MEHRSSSVLLVKVNPRSHKDQCISLEENLLKVRLRALPIEGKANEALIAFLASILAIPKSKISLRKGKSSKVKELLIQDLSPEELQSKLQLHLAS